VADGSSTFWTAMLTDPDGYRIELVHGSPLTTVASGQAGGSDSVEDTTYVGGPHPHVAMVAACAHPGGRSTRRDEPAALRDGCSMSSCRRRALST
jgi:hypothetical protein